MNRRPIGYGGRSPVVAEQDTGITLSGGIDLAENYS